MRKSRKYQWAFDCISSTAEIIDGIMDNAREVTFDTFSRNCHYMEIAQYFGYFIGNQKGLHLKDDWHVSYYKSKHNNKTCYVMKHSAIEHVFLNSKES